MFNSSLCWHFNSYCCCIWSFVKRLSFNNNIDDWLEGETIYRLIACMPHAISKSTFSLISSNYQSFSVVCINLSFVLLCRNRNFFRPDSHEKELSINKAQNRNWKSQEFFRMEWKFPCKNIRFFFFAERKLLLWTLI